MRILALDLSKASTGFAIWGPADENAASGTWQLGSEYTSRGKVYTTLYDRMLELYALSPFEAIFCEEQISPGKLQGHTNVQTVKLAGGLIAAVEMFAEWYPMRMVREVNQTTWRRDFLGKLPKHMRSADLKDMAMVRARQLGFRPLKHDQAEAIGILDHACVVLELTPPWQTQLALQAQFGGRR